MFHLETTQFFLHKGRSFRKALDRHRAFQRVGLVLLGYFINLLKSDARLLQSGGLFAGGLVDQRDQVGKPRRFP